VVDVGGDVVATVILVTPARDDTDPRWGFVGRHVEAIGQVAGDVLVITPDDARAAEAAATAGGATPTRAALDSAVGARDDHTVVVVLDDPSLLAQVRVAIGDRAPVLWWSSQVPSRASVAVGERWADGIIVLDHPDAGTAGLPTWVVGAGVDAVEEPAELPPGMPLRLVALGRLAPSKGLTTLIRAVAVARSNGTDTRLRIVGPSTDAVELCHRRELEQLVRDVALTGIVTIEEPVARAAVGGVLAGAHALVDASTDDDLRLAPLEALAAGRLVLTSNRRLARLLSDSQFALDFTGGDPAQLAQRIGSLTDLWPTNLWDLTDAARRQLPAEHTRPALAAQWAEALTGVRGRAATRVAAPATGSAGDGADAANDGTDVDANGPDTAGLDVTDLDEAYPPATEEIPLDPAAAVARLLDAWAQRDVERALAGCAPGAYRHATTIDGVGAGDPAADYLSWAAQTADALESDLEEFDVIDDHTVVTVRRDRWTIGERTLEVVVRSLFELADDLVASWSEIELAPVTSEARMSDQIPSEPFTAGPFVDAVAPDALTTEGHAPEERGPDEAAPGPVPAEALASRASTPPASPATAAVPGPTVTEVPPPAGSVAERLERAEEQAHHWRRQALIWRERALEARALGEAYKSNVDDLRVIVEVLKRQAVIAARTDDDARSISWTADDATHGGAPPADEPEPEPAAPSAAAAPVERPTPTLAPAPTPTPAPTPSPTRPSTPSTSSTSRVPARRSSVDAFVARSTELARQLTRSWGKR